jgi:aminopeptidase N
MRRTCRPATRIVALALALGGCGEPDRARSERAASALPAEPGTVPAAATDPHSFARPEQVAVVHMGLRLSVDVQARRLIGTVRLLLDRRDPAAPLWLDTRGLRIVRVAAGSGTPEPTLAPTRFELGAEQGFLGSPLRVELPEGADTVEIEYETDPTASGLQWLAPEQTAGRRHPFLYTQSQAIHARSWLPCQDSPAVRTTFDAQVRAPAPLVPVMAAEALEPLPDGTARFAMDRPIPAYLVALAVGDLRFASLGPRTGVWADPTVVARAADELRDLEAMLAAAERLFGPYRWGRYDVLVLPPAFPYGGMENPRLTFATPTILAGDRSLVALIAHELAHSWSGNLVTNATWGDLWLNEGFTVYLERRIVEAVYGPERAALEAALGRQDLDRELEHELADRPDEQKLRLDLRERDPDATFSNVPYEKGALLLSHLERRHGRERFDAFLRAWFDEHAFGAVTTDGFVAFTQTHLGDTDLGAWIDAPGVPAEAPRPATDALDRVDERLRGFLAGTATAASLPLPQWSTHERIHFLRALPRDVGLDRLAELDEAFALTQSGNAEVLVEWLCIAARRGYAAADARIESFLLEVGRRKFLMPLYQALIERPETRERADRIYARARAGYHPISRKSLDALLGYAG